MPLIGPFKSLIYYHKIKYMAYTGSFRGLIEVFDIFQSLLFIAVYSTDKLFF